MRGAISLSSSRYFPIGKTGCVAAGLRQAVDIAGAYRILCLREHDRYGAAHLLQRPHARAAGGQDDVRRERDQFDRVAAKALGITGGPARVDLHVAPVGPAQVLQCLDKCYEASLPCGIVCGQSHENTDPPLPVVLLRTRRERPQCRQSRDSFNEDASSHCLPPSSGLRRLTMVQLQQGSAAGGMGSDCHFA
jgi:hypothetical protein